MSTKTKQTRELPVPAAVRSIDLFPDWSKSSKNPIKQGQNNFAFPLQWNQDIVR